MKDDKGSSDSSSASSSFSSKIGGNHNNTGTSLIIAAANAAAIKVRQRKAGRKTGVLHNCHIYPATGYTNCDISEESSNYTDTSSVTTDGDTSTTESDKASNESKASATSGANSSAVEDDFFDERPGPTSQFHHSSGLDPVTNRQIDKVINLFRARAIGTSEPTTSVHSTQMTHSDCKRKSTSATTCAKVNTRGLSWEAHMVMSVPNKYVHYTLTL